MSARTRSVTVREKGYDEEPPYTWIVMPIMMLMIGLLGGYALSLSGQRTGMVTTAPPNEPRPQGAVADEYVLSAYRDMLARDPKNVQAAISAGNLLYDAKRYAEAIPLYQQALTIDPRNVNVSTDLGTALWYSGRADEALAQYARSLQINPTHAQTLFNLGIVRSEGKHDYIGAAAAWEQLLATNPTHPNATSVRTMIAEAKAKSGA
jgi:cytochrome c-type biogenesis protein CcmH/NrfG